MQLLVKCYDNKNVKSPYNWVISHLTQPQVANQRKSNYNLTLAKSNSDWVVSIGCFLYLFVHYHTMEYICPHSCFTFHSPPHVMLSSSYALKWTKKVKKRLKKMFRPAFGCAQHTKAGRNTQQMETTDWSNLRYKTAFRGFQKKWRVLLIFSLWKSCLNMSI